MCLNGRLALIRQEQKTVRPCSWFLMQGSLHLNSIRRINHTFEGANQKLVGISLLIIL
jgi:hypothetical protein